jgi:hypothetical protein
MKIWEMEEGEGAFSHHKETKGQNISVGNAKTKSNGQLEVIPEMWNDYG